MKRLILVTALSLFIVGCTTPSKNSQIDPVHTGEVIGLTYTLTQDKLSEGDRDNIIAAYAVFSYIVDQDVPSIVNVDLKTVLLKVVDEKLAGVDNASRRAAVKVLISMYWDKLDANTKISIKTPEEQLQILKQVRLGIEMGLGH